MKLIVLLLQVVVAIANRQKRIGILWNGVEKCLCGKKKFSNHRKELSTLKTDIYLLNDYIKHVFKHADSMKSN